MDDKQESQELKKVPDFSILQLKFDFISNSIFHIKSVVEESVLEKEKMIMIDVKNAKGDLTRKERNFIKGMEERGFSGKLVRKYTNITKFKLTKSGITFEYNMVRYSRLSVEKWLENLEMDFQCEKKDYEFEKMNGEKKW